MSSAGGHGEIEGKSKNRPMKLKGAGKLTPRPGKASPRDAGRSYPWRAHPACACCAEPALLALSLTGLGGRAEGDDLVLPQEAAGGGEDGGGGNGPPTTWRVHTSKDPSLLTLVLSVFL